MLSEKERRFLLMAKEELLQAEAASECTSKDAVNLSNILGFVQAKIGTVVYLLQAIENGETK